MKVSPPLTFYGCFYSRVPDARLQFDDLTRSELHDLISRGKFTNLPIVAEHFDMAPGGRVTHAEIDANGNACCRFVTEGTNGRLIANQIRAGAMSQLSLTHTVAVKGQGGNMSVDTDAPDYIQLKHLAVTSKGLRPNTNVALEAANSALGQYSFVIQHAGSEPVVEESSEPPSADSAAAEEPVAQPVPPKEEPRVPSTPPPPPVAVAVERNAAAPSPVDSDARSYTWRIEDGVAVRTSRDGTELRIGRSTVALLRQSRLSSSTFSTKNARALARRLSTGDV